MKSNVFSIAILACSLLVLSGCNSGDETHEVAGTVQLKGGEKLKQGTIQFTSDKHTATAGLKEDGTYKLTSSGTEGDGAPAGTYKVILLGTEIGGGYDNPDEEAKAVIDAKYTSVETTPLEVKVPGGKYDFELDPAE